LDSLQHVSSRIRLARRTGRPVDEIDAESREAPRTVENGFSRRRFLVGAGAMAAATLLPPGLSRARAWGNLTGGGGGTRARVAIIGGGIAGLTAALRLKDAGVIATIYEGQARVGGRMLTERAGARSCGLCHSPRSHGDTLWDDGQYADVFGELVDTQHATMIDLANRFGLPLIDLLGNEPFGSTDTYHFNGVYYPRAQAVADFVPVYGALRKDLKAAGYPTTYSRSTAAGRALDRMTVYDWIETRVAGGHAGPMGRLLDAAYAIEYGADTWDQSALNLVYLLGYQPKPLAFSVFGQSDERYRIAGGSDRLTTAVADAVGWNAIQLERRLDALVRVSDGTYDLIFEDRGTVRADVVLLALPFTALRALDLSRAGFDALKVRAIREQGGAHNGKLSLQFSNRYWNADGPWGRSNGSTYSDTGYQATWDGTRGLPGVSGILVDYTGGSVTDATSLDHPYDNADDRDVEDDARRFLAQVEPVFPGISGAWNGKAIHSKAHLSPFFGSAYGNYKPGQYQLFCQYERVRQGNVFFAGEHTSLDFFGFMEGGASEGRAAAEEILAALGIRRANAA
jgi:monoamine oxidase